MAHVVSIAMPEHYSRLCLQVLLPLWPAVIYIYIKVFIYISMLPRSNTAFDVLPPLSESPSEKQTSRKETYWRVTSLQTRFLFKVTTDGIMACISKYKL